MVRIPDQAVMGTRVSLVHQISHNNFTLCLYYMAFLSLEANRANITLYSENRNLGNRVCSKYIEAGHMVSGISFVMRFKLFHLHVLYEKL